MLRMAAGIVRSALRVGSAFVFAVVAVSCGGDDEPAATVHSPTISNLRYSPATAAQMSGATATINGTFDFIDAGGDIMAVRITSSGGADVTTTTPQLAGITAGTAVGQVVVSVDQPGTYSFDVWVTDSMGMSSNKLSGVFEVIAPTQAFIAITGTAVKGAALGGAPATVKCAAGSGATTTTSVGTYTVSVPGGALPCAVKVSEPDGTAYHSLVPGTGNAGTFTANVSPLTDMVVAHVAGADPAAYFASFGAASTITVASVATANAYVQTAMAGLADLAGSNPVTDPLVVGNPLDMKIDQVMTGLTRAGVTVAQVTSAIVANRSAPGVVATPLAPSTAACSWLKTGKYRVIHRTETDPKYRFQLVDFDAATLTFRDSDNGNVALTSDGACQFSVADPDATVKLVASSGGLLVMHAQSNAAPAVRDLFFGMPEQTLPISELAGTWNAANWDPERSGTSGLSAVFNAEVSVDGAGQVTAVNTCVGLACKAELGPFAKFTGNATGGLDLLEGGVVIGRAFLFKTIAGQKALALLDNQNALTIFATKQRLALPAVESVSVSSIAAHFAPLGGTAEGVSALMDATIRIIAVDATANAVTRLRTSDNRVDVHALNKPLDGVRYRAYDSCTISGVRTQPPCPETVYLPLPGMGLTLSLSTASPTSGPSFEFAVAKP